MVARMREKGQVTIPSDIREALRLSKDSLLSITKVGEGILLTPNPSAFESVSAEAMNHPLNRRYGHVESLRKRSIGSLE